MVRKDGVRKSSVKEFAFPRSARLVSRGEFERVKANGKRLQSRFFVILALVNQSSQSRFGCIITRKVDKKAVKRNALRRRLREIFRKNQHKLTKSLDLVIIARRDATSLKYAEVEDQIIKSLKRYSLLQQQDRAD